MNSMIKHHLKHIRGVAKLHLNSSDISCPETPTETQDMLVAFGIYFALLGLVAWEDFRLDSRGYGFKA